MLYPAVSFVRLPRCDIVASNYGRTFCTNIVRLHGAECGLTPPWRVSSCKVHVYFWWKREHAHTMRSYRCGTSLSRLRMQNYRFEIIVRHEFGRIVAVCGCLAHPSPFLATTHCLQHSGCKSLRFGMKRVRGEC